MRTVGITAEYNPLHTGHRYHIEESKRLAGADGAVVVMSGACVQRGGWASFGKRFRAASAVTAGADLVLELPYPYSGQSAETFADGAVRTLVRAGVDAISFGSESGDIAGLSEAAKILTDEPASFRQALASGLKNGLSFPAAREAALYEMDSDASALLSSPNNILGVEYLKAVLRGGFSVDAVTVRRAGAGYHDLDTQRSFASASAIRKMIASGDSGPISEFIPLDALSGGTDTGKLLRSEYLAPKHGAAEAAVLSRLLASTPESLAAYPGMTGGLPERLIREAGRIAVSGESLSELIRAVKSRGLTWTAIERSLTALLMDAERDMLAPFVKEDYVPYLRALAFNDTGRKILRDLKEREIPVIGTPSTDLKLLNETQQKCWALESRTCDLQGLFYKAPREQLYPNDFGPGSMNRSVPLYFPGDGCPG